MPQEAKYNPPTTKSLALERSGPQFLDVAWRAKKGPKVQPFTAQVEGFHMNNNKELVDYGPLDKLYLSIIGGAIVVLQTGCLYLGVGRRHPVLDHIFRLHNV